jgi:hypothetical protein
MIAGGGEQITLCAVARLADACNIVGGDIAEVRNKLAVLRGHCDAAGRDYGTIEKTHVQHFLLVGSDVVIFNLMWERRFCLHQNCRSGHPFRDRTGPPRMGPPAGNRTMARGSCAAVMCFLAAAAVARLASVAEAERQLEQHAGVGEPVRLAVVSIIIPAGTIKTISASHRRSACAAPPLLEPVSIG